MPLRMYQLQYCYPNSDWWSLHSTHDSVKQARRMRAEVLADERKRKTSSKWRIVLFVGKVYDAAVA